MGGNTRVLIVEESNECARALEEQLLMAGGFEVVGVTHNGLEGLELLQMKQPDVLVLGVTMPGMEGMEIMQAICEGGMGRPLVFVVSSNGQGWVHQAFDEMGAEYYFRLPFPAEKIVRRISERVVARMGMQDPYGYGGTFAVAPAQLPVAYQKQEVPAVYGNVPVFSYPQGELDAAVAEPEKGSRPRKAGAKKKEEVKMLRENETQYEAVPVWTGSNPIILAENRPLNLSGSLPEDSIAIVRTFRGALVRGNDYMKIAIQEAVRDPGLLKNCTRGVYLRVAERYGITPRQVERCMRIWLRNAWGRRDESNMPLWKIVLADPEKEAVPTPKCFLTKITEQIRSQYSLIQL